MSPDAKAITLHIYNWTKNQQQGAHDRAVRIAGKTPFKIMLEAKRKAYGDVLNYIKSKYGRSIDFDYIAPE